MAGPLFFPSFQKWKLLKMHLFALKIKTNCCKMMLNSALNPLSPIKMWYVKVYDITVDNASLRAIWIEVVCLLACYKAWHLITTRRRLIRRLNGNRLTGGRWTSLPLHSPNQHIYMASIYWQRTKHLLPHNSHSYLLWSIFTRQSAYTKDVSSIF